MVGADAQGRAYHVARRAVYMVGADVPGRPPRARTGTTPVDDASARAGRPGTSAPTNAAQP